MGLHFVSFWIRSSRRIKNIESTQSSNYLVLTSKKWHLWNFNFTGILYHHGIIGTIDPSLQVRNATIVECPDLDNYGDAAAHDLNARGQQEYKIDLEKFLRYDIGMKAAKNFLQRSVDESSFMIFTGIVTICSSQGSFSFYINISHQKFNTRTITAPTTKTNKT